MWKPQLFQRELYSEILDRRFTVTVTRRTLDLIDEAYGFDFYILKVSMGLCQHTAESLASQRLSGACPCLGCRVTCEL